MDNASNATNKEMEEKCIKASDEITKHILCDFPIELQTFVLIRVKENILTDRKKMIEESTHKLEALKTDTEKLQSV